MTGRVLVDWRGHRSWWGRRWYGAGTVLELDTARAVAAELRTRGHVARVIPAWDVSSDAVPGQLSLFGGGHETRSRQ